MTDWKDTVMSEEQIDQVWPDFPKEIIDRECPLSSSELEIIARQVAIAAKVIAEAQAEISFPLGEKQGIKKVVDWIDKNCPMTYKLLERWQAFLKEIKEEK